MVQTPNGLSKNIDMSFKHVREDISKLKNSFSSLNLAIIDLNKKNIELIHAIKEIRKTTGKTEDKIIKKQIPEIQKMHSETLTFYDVKAKKRFESNEYKEIIKNKTLFAVAKSPFGSHECYRILKKV